MWKKSVLCGLAVALCMVVSGQKVIAAEPVGGRIDHRFNTSGATRLSVDFRIEGTQNGYNYYSLSPFFDGVNYGLYSGIQTTPNGPLYIFSVWNAESAYPENGAYSVAFSGEGVGYSLRKVQPWSLGTTYTVTLKREGFDAANNAWRWSSTITNISTGESTKLGEIPAPAGVKTMRTGAVFHERYTGLTPVCGTTTNLEKTSLTATNLKSDKPVSFYGSPTPGGVFASAACKPFVHFTGSSTKLVTGTGMSLGEFNAILAPPAPPPHTPAPSTQSVTRTTPTQIASENSTPQTLPATGDTIMDEATLNILAAQNARNNNVLFASIGAVFLTMGSAALYIAKNPFVLRRVPKLAAYLDLK